MTSEGEVDELQAHLHDQDGQATVITIHAASLVGSLPTDVHVDGTTAVIHGKLIVELYSLHICMH